VKEKQTNIPTTTAAVEFELPTVKKYYLEKMRM
jgi:hypothetical protein